jgi:hypothetical protein
MVPGRVYIRIGQILMRLLASFPLRSDDLGVSGPLSLWAVCVKGRSTLAP